MRWPSEQQTLDELRSRLRSAAVLAGALAVFPVQGPNYVALRADLKRIEDLARMIGYQRQDARWLQIGIRMAQVHQVTGDLLRAHSPRPVFLEIADWLGALDRSSDDLQHKSTGRVGMILPKVQNPPTRTQDRPVQVILPSAA